MLAMFMFQRANASTSVDISRRVEEFFHRLFSEIIFNRQGESLHRSVDIFSNLFFLAAFTRIFVSITLQSRFFFTTIECRRQFVRVERIKD